MRYRKIKTTKEPTPVSTKDLCIVQCVESVIGRENILERKGMDKNENICKIEEKVKAN